MTLKKIDLIQDALSQLTISGLTRAPTPRDLSLALVRLESMAAELEGRNICTGYEFTAEPDANDNAGIDLQFRQAYASNLASRLLPDYALPPNPALIAQAAQSMSNMSARTAMLRETQYPARMPMGSGNARRFGIETQYYYPVAQAPQSCDTRQMDAGEINDYAESWIDYVNFTTGEEISTYTLETSSGLLVTGDTLASPVISFRVEALTVGYQNIIITITTTTGRVNRREAPFAISDIIEAQSDA